MQINIRQMVIKEIAYRKVNFALSVVCVAVAVASVVGSMVVLKGHDVRTNEILAVQSAETEKQMQALDESIKKSMLKLGFNVVILPKAQNLGDWYADDFGAKHMPEAYVEKLASAKIITVRHLLPTLQQKLLWPEEKRKIILIGTRGEVPNIHKSLKQPLVEPVARGAIVVGYELHQSLQLEVGETVTLLGRPFTIAKCHEERGNKDDITLWIHLSQAQEMLDKAGKISAILALECACASAQIEKVRQEIGELLPETQVIERGSQAIARAEARLRVAEEAAAAMARETKLRGDLKRGRENFASVLVSVVITACAFIVAAIAYGNVRSRRWEVGVLRSMGYRSQQILELFLSKAALTGVLGSLVGIVTGIAGGVAAFASLEKHGPEVIGAGVLFAGSHESWVVLFVSIIVITPLFIAIVSWIPSVAAVRQDPADSLSRESV